MNPIRQLLGEWTFRDLFADLPDLAGFQGVVEPGQECPEGEAHPEFLVLENDDRVLRRKRPAEHSSSI